MRMRSPFTPEETRALIVAIVLIILGLLSYFLF